MFRFAQHDKWNLWRCGFNRTQTRIAHQVRLKSHLQYFNVIASEHNVRARQPTGKESSWFWLCIRLIASAMPRNDNWNLIMLSVAKHLYGFHALWFPLVFIFISDSMLVFFLQGGQGDYLRSVPLSPFDPPTPARFLEECAPHGLCHAPQRFVYVKTRT